MDNFTLLPKRTKVLLIAVVFLLVGLITFWLISALEGQGKISVEIKTAPTQAVVTIDNHRVRGKTSLRPGTHTLVVGYEGFSTYQKTFELKTGDSKTTFSVALTPQTPNAKSIAADQSKRYTEIEGLGGQKAQEESVAFLKDNPIVQNIPYKTSYYSIDYGKNEVGQLEVQITASTPLGRQVALEKIRSWGFDPTDYNIVFVGLINPFGAANSQGAN